MPCSIGSTARRPSKYVPPPSNEEEGESATVKASSASSMWTSVAGCDSLYLRMATECARSCAVEETCAGKSCASAGYSFVSSAPLNQLSTPGISLTQALPMRYLPDFVLGRPPPSASANATTSSHSAAEKSGASVT